MAASSVESTEQAMQDFSGSDAETLVKELIDNKLKANGGAFPIDDPLNGEHLKLQYDAVDFTRTIDGYGFFPDVKFHDAQDAQKKYLIDFWVMPEDGKLQVAGDPHLQGAAPGGRKMDHHGAPAHPVVVDTRLRTSRPSGDQARLGSDVRRRTERHA